MSNVKSAVEMFQELAKAFGGESQVPFSAVGAALYGQANNAKNRVTREDLLTLIEEWDTTTAKKYLAGVYGALHGKFARNRKHMDDAGLEAIIASLGALRATIQSIC